MLPVILCEDEEIQLMKLKNELDLYIVMEEINAKIIGYYRRPEELLQDLSAIAKPAVYFLDVELNSGMNGIELAEKIREEDPRGFIAFITSHQDMIFETFNRQVEAIDYIIKKEGMMERIKQVLNKALKRYGNPENMVHKTVGVSIGKSRMDIAMNEIIAVTPAGRTRKLRFYLEYGIMDCDGQMKNMTEFLDEDFIQIDKSCIINKTYISRYDELNRVIFMNNGANYSVANRYHCIVKKLIRDRELCDRSS